MHMIAKTLAKTNKYTFCDFLPLPPYNMSTVVIVEFILIKKE